MSHKKFHRFTGFTLALVLMAATLIAQPVRAAGSWYVATTGNDSNSCTSPGSPCATINGAIGKAVNGDMILVAVGTYTGTSGYSAVSISKSITLSGGWNASFTIQSGTSSIDGQNIRRGIEVFGVGVVASLDHFLIKNGEVVDSGVSIQGGGIYNEANLTITNSIIQNNKSSVFNWGGGIYNQFGTMTLINTTISNNTSPSEGGGIANLDGTMTLNNTTISNNTSSSNGGGIFNYYGGTMYLNNSTISGNSGNGIYNYGNISLNNATVSNNSAHTGGGIYTNGSLTIKNSIVSGNTILSSAPDCYGMVTSAGNNIIGNTAGCIITATSGDQFNIDPLLGTFLPAQGYHPLIAGSPASDAGNPITCLSSDQRGMSRVGTCDVGAYEYTIPGTATGIFIVNGANQHTAPNLAFPKYLQAAVIDINGSPVSGINVTFTAPPGGASGIFANTGTNTTSAITDAGGVSTTSIFTANSQLGTYTVSASASGLGSVNFNLENYAWFVSVSGNDSNSCLTSAFPCATINGAIGKAVNGDTILVAVGSYVEIGTEVGVVIDKSIALSGGWNSTFTNQSSVSTVDGENVRMGILTFGQTVSLDHFVIQNGKSSSYGGGITNSGNLTITNSFIQNNVASYASSFGGGIYSPDGYLNIVNSKISNNTASYGGGGVYSGAYNSGILNLTNTIIINNNAARGGGVFNDYGTVNINNTTVSNNTATYGGGGIYNVAGNMDLVNTTVSNNSVVEEGIGGGGIYDGGIINLNNITVHNNTASHGGGIAKNGGSISIQNSIVANNIVTNSGADCIIYVGALTSGYNIIGDTSDCNFTPTTGDLINVDPILGPLQDNGGPTFTHALLAGSPAINTGNPATCLTSDQRGIIRPEGSACEIGAYEVNIPIIASIKRSNSNPTNASSVNFSVKFSESVTGVNSSAPFDDFALITTGVTGLSIAGVSGSGDNYTVTVNTGSGSGTIRLDVVDDDSIKDSSNNPLGGAGASNGNYSGGETYTIDKIPPTVSSITRADSDPTNASSVDFIVTFDEAVTAVDSSDFVLTTSGITGSTVTSVSGSDNTYTVTVNTSVGTGTIRLDIPNSAAIADLAGNSLGSLPFTSGETYTIIPPTVSSIIRADSNPTNKASVKFTVKFDEAVTGVDTSDFNLITTGVKSASITNVSGSGATYTVRVNTGSKNGTIRLDVTDDDSIKDLATNPLGGEGAGNGDFTTGEVYDVDKTIVFNSIGSQDGWILESTEISGVGGSMNSSATLLYLGDDAVKKQYRSILSFNTSSLPDNAVITKVTLKLKKQGVVGGGDPVAMFQGFMADVRKGSFGAAGLAIGDFQAVSNKTIGPVSPTLTSGWYSLNLTPAKATINKLTTSGGLTQIRVRFKLDDNNNAIANYLKIYSGNAPAASRPQLIVEYYVQ